MWKMQKFGDEKQLNNRKKKCNMNSVVYVTGKNSSNMEDRDEKGSHFIWWTVFGA
jgi:hypothetical protein